MTSRRAFFLYVAIAVNAAPIFIDLDHRRLTLIYLFSKPPEVAGQHLHPGFLLFAAAFVVVLVSLARTGRWRDPFRHRLVLGLVIAFSVSLVAGQLIHGSRLSYLYYLQTVSPLLAFFTGAHLDGIESRLDRVAAVIVATMTVSLLLVSAYVIPRTFRAERVFAISRRLRFAIPQLRDMLPIVALIALAFAVAYRDRLWFLSVAFGASLVLFLPLVWSRSAIVMLLIAISLLVWKAVRSPASSRRLRLTLVVTGAVLLAGIVVLSTGPGSLISQRTRAAQARSAENRVAFAKRSVGLIVRSPVYGRAFRPEYEGPQGTATFPRVYPSHNQYLDYGLRGGIAAPVLLVMLLAGLVRRSYRLSDDPNPNVAAYHHAMFAFLPALAVGCLFQPYLIAPWPGGLIWFLMGAATRDARVPSTGRGSRPP